MTLGARSGAKVVVGKNADRGHAVALLRSSNATTLPYSFDLFRFDVAFVTDPETPIATRARGTVQRGDFREMFKQYLRARGFAGISGPFYW